MAENKKSFIFYCDWKTTFDQLPNEKAGELVKFMLAYVNDEEPTTDDILINAVFANMKNTLKRDLKKYEKIREKRSEAGKISAQKRAEQNKQMSTHVESVEQRSTNSTVSDNDNVSVNDSDNENVLSCYEKCLQHFPDTLQPKKGSIKKKWIDTIEKLNRIDGIPFEMIEKIVEVVRNDSFWAQNFQSMVKLRRKDPDGVLYIVSFYEKFKNQLHGKSKNSRNQGATTNEIVEAWATIFEK